MGFLEAELPTTLYHTDFLSCRNSSPFHKIISYAYIIIYLLIYIQLFWHNIRCTVAYKSCRYYHSLFLVHVDLDLLPARKD